MIDGVKIDVPNLTGNEWLSNNLLDFYTYTNTNTGELKDGTRVAKYKGLSFIITQSTKYKGLFYYSVRGSLHKYYNNGETNATDFTFSQLQTVIIELSRKFNIDPATAILRNLEFGVNIYTSIPAKSLINNLVALYNDPFTDFKIDGLKIGKAIGKQRYRIKIYDKGKQEGLPTNNLVRLEIAVKKMQYLKKYGIEKLADLLDFGKVQPLGGLMVDYWRNVIYYDKQVNWKGLSDFERKKLLYYATPRNWQDFNPMQRMRAKVHFNKIISQYGATSTLSETGNLIAEKWDDLVADKCIGLTPDISESRSNDLYMIDPLECTVKTYTKPTPDTKPKTPRKMNLKNPCQKVNFCRTCAKDISNKKRNSLYCSKRCNNSHHAKERKKDRHFLKIVETPTLNFYLHRLKNTRLSLLVEYRDNGICEAVSLYQNEINAPFPWVRKVIKVTLLDTGETLTSHRAKRLINNISKLNNLNLNK